MTPSHDTTSTNGNAAERTVPMFTSDSCPAFPSLAVRPDPPPPRDLSAEVRKLLFAVGKPMTIAQMQDELGEPHVALGEIDKALADIHARKTSGNGFDTWSLLSIEDAEKLLARRADVLEALWNGPASMKDIADDAPSLDQQSITDAIASLADASLVVVDNEDQDTPYQLTASASDKIIRMGAEVVARETLPELATPVDGAQKLTDEQARHRLTKDTLRDAERRIERLLSWFAKNGVPDPSAAVAAPEATPVQWMRMRSRLEDLPRLVDERAALEAELEAEVDGAKEAKKTSEGRAEKIRNKINIVVGQMTGGPTYFIDKLVTKVLDAGRFKVFSAEEHDRGSFLGWDDEGVTAAPAPPMFAAETSPVAESIPPAKDEHDAAADEATQKQAEKAAKIPTGPKGELTMERVLAEAETLLRGFGTAGLEWGKNGEDAVTAIARTVSGKNRGRLPGGLVAFSRAAVNTLLNDGRAIRHDDAIVWAGLGFGNSKAAG